MPIKRNANNTKPTVGTNGSGSPIQGLPTTGKDLQKLVDHLTASIKQDNLQSAEQPKPKSFLQKLGSAAMGTAKALAPSLASMIPGIGPMASSLLTTMNDDEWFSEYKGNGATFNEWLQLTTEKDGANNLKALPLGAMVEFPTGVLSGSSAWEDYMPSILAYIREKTNNVLVDDTDLYRQAFEYASKLLIVYYSGCKLLDLSANQPLNIPDIPLAIPVISPENYAAFGGMMKSLKEFISSSIRLPYAWTEYIRWRFGTTFHSDETGKPGLIMYTPHFGTNQNDHLNLSSGLSVWSAAIASIKSSYIASGRAGADIKLAYSDHAQRLDVEPRHYDEKEFNLRCNLTVDTTTALTQFKDGVTILMDSRLDMNAAIQAITISTAHGYLTKNAPFPVKSCLIYFYLTTTARNAMRSYWVSGTDRSATMRVGSTIFDAKYPDTRWQCTDWTNTYNDVFVVREDNSNSYQPMVGGNSAIEAAFAYYNDQLALALATSMQLHNRSNYSIIGYDIDGSKVSEEIGLAVIKSTPLAYDIAIVNHETIANLHRSAIRNLTRGNYKNKTPDGSKVAVKESVVELTKLVS